MSKQIIHTDKAPAALGPYSQAVSITGGRIVFISGQLGMSPQTGELVSDNFAEQVRQAFKNLHEIIKASGADFVNIVKLTLFVTDLKNFTVANSIMSELFPEPFPARSTVEVSALPKNAQFEVEAIIAV